MEFPFGHRHHHHNTDDDDSDGNRHHHHHPSPFPPPAVYPPPPFAAPPPHHISHESPSNYHLYPPPGPPSFHDRAYNPPPPFASGSVHHLSHDPGLGYAPPPPFAGAPPVQHVAHEIPYGNRSEYSEHVSRQSWDGGALSKLRTVRIYTKAEENYSLSIRDGKVVLELKNHDDKRQHWIKDLKYSTKIKDEEGFPAFALVNKATGEAVKHSVGATKPVSLVPYNPDVPDESVLWSESKDLGDGFRCIRMVNNIRLNFDAFNGDEQHGGVHDGTFIVLWEWAKGKNQRWKIVPY